MTAAPRSAGMQVILHVPPPSTVDSESTIDMINSNAEQSGELHI